MHQRNNEDLMHVQDIGGKCGFRDLSHRLSIVSMFSCGLLSPFTGTLPNRGHSLFTEVESPKSCKGNSKRSRLSGRNDTE
jgi:hypothetical protein